MTAPAVPPFAPTVLGRLFALRSVQPFDRLHASELVLLAEVTEPRSYAPGENIHPGHDPMSYLLVVVGGRALTADGTEAGPILGVSSLLNNLPPPHLVADPATGVQALAIAKGHFFTMSHECPRFILGLLELGEHGVRVTAP
jgi:signal-transduction protein with cAMP-binding, CBS, and nucleotidyltransferase domain